MVLFIKTQNNLDDDIELLCKMMINMEQNKHIFDGHGNRITSNSNRPFNNYTFQQVDYDISIYMGVVLLYVSEPIDNKNIKDKFISKFSILESNTELQLPVFNTFIKSTTYTVTTKKYSGNTTTSSINIGRSYRKLFSNKNDINKISDFGPAFIWLLQIVCVTNIDMDYPYLQISELNNMIPSKSYLMKSISTIIYDNVSVNLFNEKHMTKQLDYPSLNQYNMFKNNKILDEVIHISDTTGLDYEIVKCYKSDVSAKIDVYLYDENLLHNAKFINFEELKVRRRDITKPWFKQLLELYDYNKQELMEKNLEFSGKPSFPNDTCFISGMPLYDKVYVLKVVSMLNKDIISYILVCPYIYHVYHKTNKVVSSLHYYMKHNNVKILYINITNFPRIEYEAISMIPDKLINPLKKDIMLAISENGIYFPDNINSRTLKDDIYTVDLKKNCVYIGILNINDVNVIKYQNTNSILFQYINLDLRVT
jgi:hypothetical protein